MARRAPGSADAASADRRRRPAGHLPGCRRPAPGPPGRRPGWWPPRRRAARARPWTPLASTVVTEVWPAVQDHGRISLRDNGIDSGKDLQLRTDRGVGAQRVDGTVRAAENQFAVGAAGDRGEFGAVLAVDRHPVHPALRDIDARSTRRASIRRRDRCCRRSSPSPRRAADTARPSPFAGSTVTTACSALSGPSTTNDGGRGVEQHRLRVTRNRAHHPRRRLVRAEGRTAASAGAIVGGGASDGFDVHAVTPHPSKTSTPQHAS